MKAKNRKKTWFVPFLIGLFVLGLTTVSASATAMKRPVVKASTTADSYVKVSWSTQPDVNGYRIYRKTSTADKWVCQRSVNSRISSYTDKNVESGKTYCYTVRAFRKATTSQGTGKTTFGPYNGGVHR